MKTLRYLIPAVALGFLTSCEPKEDSSNPTPSGPVYGDTIAIKSGKGFSSLAILLSSIAVGGGANGGGYDQLGMVDMTMLPDGKTLHMALSGTVTTQQDPMNALDRRAIDVETKTFLAGPTSNIANVAYEYFNAKSSTFGNRNYGYQYGTPKFYSSATSVSNFGIVTSLLTGDFSYTNQGTFAAQARVTSLGEVMENVRTQVVNRIDGNYNDQIFFQYKTASGQSYPFDYYRVVHRDNKAGIIIGGTVETATQNASKVIVFGFSKNQLYVAESDVFAATKTLVMIDSIPFPQEWSSPNIATRLSDDGSGFGVVVGNSETDGSLSLLSARYDLTTRKLTRNIHNLSIPQFSAGKVNYDIDDQGNMYFDHWAGNFQSDSTISIYKASGNAFSVVGQDDILKSGSIVNVRFLHGKVYAAVYYRYTISYNGVAGSKQHRMAVIKQD